MDSPAINEIALDIWEYAKHTVGMVGTTILLLIVIAAVLLLQRAKSNNVTETNVKNDRSTRFNVFGSHNNIVLDQSKSETMGTDSTKEAQEPPKRAMGSEWLDD